MRVEQEGDEFLFRRECGWIEKVKGKKGEWSVALNGELNGGKRG